MDPIEFKTLAELRDQERSEEIRAFIVTAMKYLSAPILLGLWVLDMIYVPHLIWITLAIRLTSIPLVLLTIWLFRKPVDLTRAQQIGTFTVMGNAGIITALIWVTEGISSPYYAGLNLVTMAVTCIPSTTRYVVLNMVLVYYPFLIMGIIKGGTNTQARVLCIHLFFIAGTVLMSVIMRLYMERLRLAEIKARLALKDEVISRDGIIRIKTEEMVNLNQLVKQFSPQVVRAIQTGEISLEDTVESRHICAVFIDIVKSTDRMQMIPIDEFTEVIASFMRDTTHILLDHDVTIDKYLGDGVLAFSGAPMNQEDYLLRVVHSATEIREYFQRHQDKYLAFWKHPFEVRFGIASGSANVGFYGSEKSFRSYTAIGEPVNLAARLCAAAEPNTILVDGPVYEAIKDAYETEPNPKKTFKGFEGRTFDIHSIGHRRRKTAKAA